MDKISVCLVDDEKDVVEGFSASLGDEFEVRTFLSPAMALKAFEDGYAPAIVVSDLQMPEMNGLKFIEKMKQRGVNSKVIVSSGYADKNAAVSAVNLGVNGFLEKPFTVRHFKEMLNQLAGERPETRELVNDLNKLNELYFRRAVLAENFIFEKGMVYPERNDEKREFLNGIKEENELANEVERRMKKIFNEDF